ncbi:MAG: DUF4245 domain-containing protein [Geodermatophilaceae bacterium]|nr:DUF4245 domain-containing protein [Geodermatophilaceae bacterium]
MPDQTPASRRQRSTSLDLLRSLLPLVVLILVMAWLYRPSDPAPVTEIDPGPAVNYAATIADFDVLAASELPSGWLPTSARVDPDTAGGPVGVTVGYVTPAGNFAQVVHSSVPAAQLLVDVLGEGYTDIDIDADGWRRFETGKGEQALVLSSGDSTVVVTGSADLEELRVLAAALRPVSG